MERRSGSTLSTHLYDVVSCVGPSLVVCGNFCNLALVGVKIVRYFYCKGRCVLHVDASCCFPCFVSLAMPLITPAKDGSTVVGL